MAWPYNARSNSFIAKEIVPSAFLNDLQDKIIRLSQEEFFPLVIAQSEISAGAHIWVPNSPGFLLCAVGGVSGQNLRFLYQGREDFILNSIAVKYGNAAVPSAANVAFVAKKLTQSFDVVGTAPSSTAIGTINVTSASAWSVTELTGIGSTFTANDILAIDILSGGSYGTPTTNDECAIQVGIVPITY